jgi:cytochrome c553
MNMRVFVAVAVAGVAAACASGSSFGSAPATASASSSAEGANGVLPWAFVVNDPAPSGAAAPDPNEVVTVPGSRLSMRRSDININNGPPDWHPEGHPPMPEIVAKGLGGEVVACGYCHLPNGQGKPENAGLAGQPVEYLMQQMEDYRNGLRRAGEPRMGPTARMMRIGAATTEEQARVAAEYFASIEFEPWIRVVETDRVPVTRFAGSIHQVVEGGGEEPIGVRVVEVPNDLHLFELRDDASSFTAYVPRGALRRGAELVNNGGGGRTVACTTCHGADLRGIGPVPALAGRSPTYMARQLYDLQQRNRDGAWSDLMDRAVRDLTVDDIVAIVAYTASLDP